MNLAGQKSIEVLVIEDDQIDAIAIEKTFKNDGSIKLTMADDGEEALDLLSGNKGATPSFPMIILLDLQMPKVSGIQFLKELRKNSQYCCVPVFILTTSEDISDIDQCYLANATGYLCKRKLGTGYAKLGPFIREYIDNVRLPGRCA